MWTTTSLSLRGERIDRVVKNGVRPGERGTSGTRTSGKGHKGDGRSVTSGPGHPPVVSRCRRPETMGTVSTFH